MLVNLFLSTVITDNVESSTVVLPLSLTQPGPLPSYATIPRCSVAGIFHRDSHSQMQPVTFNTYF